MRVLIILTFLMSFSAMANCGKYGNFCKVDIIKVYDGDTFFVNIPKLHSLFGEKLGIRVKGVDTPELRSKSVYEKAMAVKAKEFTKKALDSAKRVDLVDCVRGKYFRIVCNISYDGNDLSADLIKAGLAVKYDK